MKFNAGWYVLYVRANHEQKTHTLLLRKELKSFLPTTEKLRKYKNCKKFIFVPLFPSYVFVKLNSPLDLHKALSLRSSCSFVKFDGNYALLSDEEISKIRLLSTGQYFKELEVNAGHIKVGDYKKLTASPFQGMECEVVNVKNKNKIIVRLKSIRQNVMATIPLKYIT